MSQAGRCCLHTNQCFPRQELVEQLKSRIQDLQALTSQAERRSRRQEVSHQAVARRGKPEFGKFRTIQRAACDLHKALVAACSKHIVHNVQLCLLPRVTREFTQVRFTVSFGGSQTQEALTTSRSLWLAIESVIKDTVTPIGEHPDDVPTGITISLKRQHSPDQLEIARKPRKRVQFAPPPSPTCQRLTLCESNRSSPDLELRGNLCSVLQRYLRQQRLAYNPCLGFLEVTADFKHLIYIDSPSSDANASMSLASLLASWHKRNVITGLSQYERVQLAKCLATAVLYYRASPWLKQSWRSEDIYFCRLDKHASPTLLASMSRIYKTPLYVNSSIRGPESEEEERCQTLDSSSSPSASFHLTRNPILFGLGTMLLELAFEAPFKSLQRPIDIRQGGREEFAEYFTATRLSKLVSTKMCKSYKDIVERCLHCDFGCGDDLSDPTLQERFYSQVVCELDQLEKKVRALYSSLE